MTEEANVNVNEEVVPPAETAAQSAPESDQERNWRRAREQLEHSRARIEELESKLQGIQAAQAPKEPEVDPLASLGDDDVLTVKEATLLAKRLVANEISTYQKQKDLEVLPERLQARYPDFHSVVTKENVEKLKATKPELFRVISASPDPFAAAIAAYEFISSTDPEVAKYSQYRDRIEANAKKPMSPSAAPAASDKGELRMNLDKKGKAQRWEEMQRLARRA